MSTRDSKVHALNIAHIRTTKNTLQTTARQTAIELLDGLVACTTDLALAARQAHWNVRGKQFLALHDLFGRISDELNRHTDVMAGRAAAIGGIPRCTAQSVVAATKLKPYPIFGFDGVDHVEELARRMAVLSAEIRQAILTIEGQRDPVTAHHLVDTGAAVDHLLWLLESQIPIEETERPGNAPA